MDSLHCWNQNLLKERSFYHEFWEEILFNGQKSVDGKKKQTDKWREVSKTVESL